MTMKPLDEPDLLKELRTIHNHTILTDSGVEELASTVEGYYITHTIGTPLEEVYKDIQQAYNLSSVSLHLKYIPMAIEV